MLATLAILSVLALSFKNTPANDLKSLEGTWELVSIYHYGDGVNITDTILKAEGYRQVKMFSKGKVMWTMYDPDKAGGRFGFGTYEISKDRLMEKMEFGDNILIKDMNQTDVFSFELMTDDNTYSQINFDGNNKRTFSENYIRIN